MSKISKVIDNFLKEYVSPSLAKEGFRKKGRRWYRELDDRIERIYVELRSWNNDISGQFSLSCYIEFPVITDLLATEANSRWTYYGQVTYDLEHYLDKTRNTNWTVLSDNDNSLVGKSLNEAIETQVLTWFINMRTHEKLSYYLEEKNHNNLYVAAVYHATTGNLAKAFEIVNSLSTKLMRHQTPGNEMAVKFEESKTLAFLAFYNGDKKLTSDYIENSVNIFPQSKIFWENWCLYHNVLLGMK